MAIYVKVQVLVAQSCPTLCDPMDYSSPGSSVHGVFQARILKWIAISFSKGSSRPRNQTWVSVSLLSEPPGKLALSLSLSLSLSIYICMYVFYVYMYVCIMITLKIQ